MSELTQAQIMEAVAQAIKENGGAGQLAEFMRTTATGFEEAKRERTDIAGKVDKIRTEDIPDLKTSVAVLEENAHRAGQRAGALVSGVVSLTVMLVGGIILFNITGT